MTAYLKTALTAGRAAAEHINKSLSSDLIISTKSNPRDIVTQVDMETETIIRSIIQKEFSDHSFLGEEQGRTGNSDYCWIIDPIDGTNNFARNIPHYCVSIGLRYKQEGLVGVIVNPSNHEIYSAQKDKGSTKDTQVLTSSDCTQLSEAFASFCFGSNPKDIEQANPIWENLLTNCHVVRRLGATALELAYLAEGKTDIFVGLSQNPWDTAAGTLVAKEAGGIVKVFQQGSICLASSSEKLMDELITTLEPLLDLTP